MNKNDKKEESVEMSIEEARALRAANHASRQKEPTEKDNREAFRIFWAQEKAKYGKGKELEPILWLHLKAIGMDSPEKFTSGLKNFGLKEVR